MICATKLHQKNDVIDTNWLIDFDLKILASDVNKYETYYQQIRKEYKIYPDLLYKPGRKKALQHFLANDFIFQTEVFSDKYETQARLNIQKEINTL
jgi:predicted metal-dependent HD superfamily phosphohydrolase